MSRLDALIAECAADPADDAPRMVWADAIGGERGELVTLQCGRDELSREQLVARNRRERELLAAHGAEWAGLGTLVYSAQFRRGFVDAIEVDVDAFLAEHERMFAIAPFVTALTVHGADHSDRLQRVLACPGMERISGLELVARSSARLDRDAQPWGDVAANALARSGIVPRLVALGLPRHTEAAIATISDAGPVRLERLWLRETRDWTASTHIAAHRLVELDARVPVELLPALPELRSLVLRGARNRDVERLAELGVPIERLVLDPIGTTDPLSPDDIRALERCVTLRALELRGDATSAVIGALATLRLPALRELRLGWCDARELEAVVAHFGPQLDLLDLRAAPRIRVPELPCDVLVDEPIEPELLHVRAHDHASARTPVHRESPGCGVAAWIVAETGTLAGRVWPIAIAHGGRIDIGRSTYGDIVVYSSWIARLHARIDRNAYACRIRDLGSSNGTLLDHVRMDEAELHDDMRITIGDVMLRFFATAGGGERATACARALATIEPLTGLPRATRADAARVRLANHQQIQSRFGHLGVLLALVAIGQHLRALDGVSYPGDGEFAIYPPERAPDLVAAAGSHVQVESASIEIRFEILA